MSIPSDPNMPTSTLVRLGDVQLEVFEAGSRGKPIMLCHGWPEHAYAWRFQIPVLADAGYHVIVPNQRGYGRSSCPQAVDAYDLNALSGDLIHLLAHYGYEDAVFVGHDWGAMVVWGLALLHPTRVKGLANFALPYQERGAQPWLSFMEAVLGPDNYFVHFNRQPGVADAVLDAHTTTFLQNLFRKNLPNTPPEPGMLMTRLARAAAPKGEPLMTPADLSVFVQAFEKTGFTPSINWYRNLDRNWHLLADVDPVIQKPALMVYGARDTIPPAPNLATFVPRVEVATLDAGHWIQQERPAETNRVLLDWLSRQAFFQGDA